VQAAFHAFADSSSAPASLAASSAHIGARQSPQMSGAGGGVVHGGGSCSYVHLTFRCIAVLWHRRDVVKHQLDG